MVSECALRFCKAVGPSRPPVLPCVLLSSLEPDPRSLVPMSMLSHALFRRALGAATCCLLLGCGEVHHVDDPIALLEAASARLSQSAGEMGPAPAWMTFASGTLNQSAELQGSRAGSVDTSRFREVLVSLPDERFGHEYEHHRIDGTHDRVREVYDGGSKTIHVLEEGFSVRLTDGPEISGHTRLRRRMPHVLVAEALTVPERVVGADVGGVGPAVTFRLSSGPPLTLTFDPVDTVLVSVSYRATLPGLGDATVGWSFCDYREVPGVGLVPYAYGSHIADAPFTAMRVDSILVDSATAHDFAQPPAGHDRVIDVPPTGGDATVRARVDTVQPGVFVVRNLRTGFHPMFVEFADFLVALDAPAGYPIMIELPAGDVAPGPSPDWLSRRYIELMREVVPDKPIRFVVVTHFHNDHGGGVRAFAAEGATVLTAAADADVVRRYLNAPHTASPDLLSQRSVATTVEVVRDRRVITDGSRTLEVHATGSNPHTADMLVAFLPSERVMFVSDLMNGAPPPTLRAGDNPPLTFFLRWLSGVGLAPQTIVTMHGNPVSEDEWRQAAASVTQGASQ